MHIDSQALRTALGRFATGVTIVTCRDASGHSLGLTVNSFASLSLDPPLVLWSLRAASPNLAAFETASHFAVNVLTEAQLPLSRRFASPVHDKFDEGAWSAGEGGAPVLAGCAAVFECSTERFLPAGDHVLFIGRVRAAHQAMELAPLLFHGGHYRQLGKAL